MCRCAPTILHRTRALRRTRWGRRPPFGGLCMAHTGWTLARFLALAAALALTPGVCAQNRKPEKPVIPAAPDPAEILRGARSAILMTRTVMYNARVEPIGVS